MYSFKSKKLKELKLTQVYTNATRKTEWCLPQFLRNITISSRRISAGVGREDFFRNIISWKRISSDHFIEASYPRGLPDPFFPLFSWIPPFSSMHETKFGKYCFRVFVNLLVRKGHTEINLIVTASTEPSVRRSD